MHYGLWDFSKYKPEIKKYKIKKENYKTIKVRSDYEILTPEQELKIGDVDDLSETDIYEVNVMYGCYGVFLFFQLITISFVIITLLIVDALQPLRIFIDCR